MGYSKEGYRSVREIHGTIKMLLFGLQVGYHCHPAIWHMKSLTIIMYTVAFFNFASFAFVQGWPSRIIVQVPAAGIKSVTTFGSEQTLRFSHSKLNTCTSC